MSKASFDSLKVSTTQIKRLLSAMYGLTVKELKPLSGEVDFNFKLTLPTGENYLLKISRPDCAPRELAFQAAMMDHLKEKSISIEVPEVVPTLRGDWGESFTDNVGRERWIRLQSWISGREIGQVSPRSPQLLERWGAACGEMALALKGFDHAFAHRDFRWDPCQVLATRSLEDYIDSEDKRSLLNYFWNLYEEQVQSVLPALRKSVNHNDSHERNVLVDFNYADPQVKGIIDFGDAVYTATVNEVAIAAAYAIMQQENPLQSALSVVRGFHSVFPLKEAELAVLYPLICARLVISVCYSAKNKVEEPENKYLQVSDQDAWKLLHKLRSLNPVFAESSFRAACGWEAYPGRAAFDKWVKEEQPIFRNVIKVVGKRLCFLDLSVGGKVLGTQASFETQKSMHRTIYRYLEDHRAQLAIGGYLETRPLYTTDSYETLGNEGPQWRTVHLGLDFWEKAGTPIYAPYKGRVFSIQDNALDRDYGPTIILEHRPTDSLTFYTLFGHLSRKSLEGLKQGDLVEAGQEIARIGSAPENGNWPPHLHFQLILDLLGKEGNFPGVAFPQEIKVWESICPNPQFIIPDLADITIGHPRLNKSQILGKRKQILGKGLSLSYRNPLHMVRGAGAYLYDINGQRFLDTVNNVAHVGHEHPKVVAAGQHQMAVLNTNTRYLHENIIAYAEELLASFPKEFSVVHFVNSGSEANELALRMVQTISGSREMIALQTGYHGNTGRTIDVSSYKFDGKAGTGAPSFTHIVPMPDTFRGLHRDPTTAADDYAAYIDQRIAMIKGSGKKLGGFIAEPIMSCGGQIVLPQGYLQRAYAKVRNAGGLCIADEVQIGFGRTGTQFWGYEWHGVLPDIVTLGKPIGNGHPMGAVVCTAEVAEAFATGMEFFSTFGGNPVSAAIGKAVLTVIKEEGLQDNAQKVGQYLKEGLIDLQDRHPVIGEVRGQGLFLGFELVDHQVERNPLPAVASYLSNRMRTRGVLTSTDGPQENVIKIKPPICFSRKQADFFLDQLDLVLAEDYIRYATR